MNNPDQRLRFGLTLILSALSAAGLAMYAAIAVLDNGHAVQVVAVGAAVWLATLVGFAHSVGRGYLSTATLDAWALSLPLLGLGLFSIDCVYSSYVERSAPPPPADDRRFDGHYAAGDFYPPLYYPTERNFRLHRPGFAVAMAQYGDYYSSQLQQSARLRSEVLTLRRVAIEIDAHGLRESRPIDGARVVALGDSFTFGWGVNDDETWVRQLERLRGERIVNLGVHDGSPKQQLELFKYLLATQGERLPIKQVVWLFYEGNDLEDSYDDLAPPPAAKPWQRGLGPLLDRLFASVKDNMVIEQFRQQRVQWSGATTQRDSRHLQMDGVPLDVPFYQSPTLGSALFLSTFIERAQQPASYVAQHPNLARLDQTLTEMAALAKARGFSVSIAMAPTAVRLHGRYFDDFPTLSARPYFIDAVATLAAQHGFQFVNLLDVWAEQAGQTYLHFRDDDHWSPIGHARAAEALAKQAL